MPLKRQEEGVGGQGRRWGPMRTRPGQAPLLLASVCTWVPLHTHEPCAGSFVACRGCNLSYPIHFTHVHAGAYKAQCMFGELRDAADEPWPYHALQRSKRRLCWLHASGLLGYAAACRQCTDMLTSTDREERRAQTAVQAIVRFGTFEAPCMHAGQRLAMPGMWCQHGVCDWLGPWASEARSVGVHSHGWSNVAAWPGVQEESAPSPLARKQCRLAPAGVGISAGRGSPAATVSSEGILAFVCGEAEFKCFHIH